MEKAETYIYITTIRLFTLLFLVTFHYWPFPKPLHLSLVFSWGWYLSWWLGSSLGERSACNAGDQVQLLGQEDPLEKGMATHSSILAWRIPWTEKPGGP